MDHYRLRFIGAAGTVTGSCTLVESAEAALMVDCGMFQGAKSGRLRNWQPLPVEPAGVSAIVLTHGHLDHCGLLPRFMLQGYGGPIFCSPPTSDVAAIILRDSARIQEEDAERANRLGYTKHSPAQPLYTRGDVEAVLAQFEPMPLDEWRNAEGGFRVRLRNSGHILGSTLVEVQTPERRFAFSGDLGRTRPLLLEPASVPEECAALVLESTYGDRTHPASDPMDELGEIVRATVSRGGNVIIPSFAVERAQELLVLLSRLRTAGALPPVEVFLDSPMGASVTDLLGKHRSWHRLSDRELEHVMSGVTIIRNMQESLRLLERAEPAVIIAGSGMLTGGRVLQYVDRHGGNPATTILLSGFQVPGTRGHRLLAGARELKFYGQIHPIRAEVRQLENLSAHADQAELLAWLARLTHHPRVVHLNHGEVAAAESLAIQIRDRFGWQCRIAEAVTTRPRGG